jgi:hypothetical protein
MQSKPNIKVDEEGLPDWEPVSFYDAPATILTQLFDGEGSLGRAVRTLVEEESLSPRERDSFVQRIKKQYGGNALVDTTIDLATNPLIWLLMMTSPVTRKQFAKAGGRALAGASEVGKVGRKFVDGLRHMNLLGSAFMNEHGLTSRVINHLTNRKRELMERMHELGGAERAAMLEHIGRVVGSPVDDFDHTRFSGVKYQKLSLLNKITAAMQGGLFEDDAIPTTFVRSMTRVATVQDSAGNASVRILPAIPDKTAHLKYKQGAKVTFADSDEEFEIIDEPIVTNSQANHKAAREKLGKDLPHITVEAVEIPPEGRLPMTRAQAMSVLANEGFDPNLVVRYVESRVRQQKDLITKAMGEMVETDAGPRVRVNTEKILKMLQQHKAEGGSFIPSTAEEQAIMELVGGTSENLLPDWVIDAVRDNTMNKKTLTNLVRELYETQINNPHYAPRSIANQYTKAQDNLGVRVEPYDVIGVGDEKGKALKVRSAALIRDREDVLLDPGDLQEIYQSARGFLSDDQAEMFQNRIERTRFILNQKLDQNKIMSTLPLDFERAGRAYEQKMMGHIMLYGDDVPEFLNAELETVKRSPKKLDLTDRTYFELDEPDKFRRDTYRMLGITEERLERIAFGDATYPPEIKFDSASRVYRQKIANIQDQLDAGVSSEAQLIRLEQLKAKYERERDFIREYRDPFVSARKPSNIRELLSVLLPRENQHTNELMQDFIIPRVFGGAQGKHLVAMTALQSTRSAMQTFVNSRVGKFFEETGGPLGQLYEKAKSFAERPVYLQDASNLSRNTAGYLYANHLSGLMTGVYNAMQPFTWGATWLGVPEILAAMPKAVRQVMAYKADRVKYGVVMDPEQRRKLWKKHVRLADFDGRDLTMMDDGVLSSYDSAILSSPIQTKPGLLRTVFMELPLKLFQTIEQVNRVAMAEAGISFVNKNNLAAGIRRTSAEIADEVQTIQSMSNFAPQLTTRPRLLMDPKTGAGLLANPAMGMLLQFPLRFATTPITAGAVYGGKRSFGLQKFGGPEFGEIPAQVGDVLRVLGISAAIYEMGKNLMGVDLSPGLSAAALGGFAQSVGGGWLPVPVDIATGIVGGLLEQDREQIRRQLFRLAPAGIPLSKALGALPPIPGGGPFGLLQSQYADWSNPNEQGMIPVYKDDGTLQSFSSPLELVMRGVGFNPQKFQSPEAATKFLLANRRQIVDLKRKYKDAVLANNMPLATQIEGEYRTRFGVSMTVKPTEWDQAIKLREVSVSERMVDTLPGEVRGAFQQALASDPMASRMGLPEGGLYAGETARQRESIRGFNVDVFAPNEGD